MKQSSIWWRSRRLRNRSRHRQRGTESTGTSLDRRSPDYCKVSPLFSSRSSAPASSRPSSWTRGLFARELYCTLESSDDISQCPDDPSLASRSSSRTYYRTRPLYIGSHWDVIRRGRKEKLASGEVKELNKVWMKNSNSVPTVQADILVLANELGVLQLDRRVFDEFVGVFLCYRSSKETKWMSPG